METPLLSILIPLLLIVLLVYWNNSVLKKKKEEEEICLRKLHSVGLSKSDIIYIGEYVGGEYKLSFNAECFIQDGDIKFADVRNSPNHRFRIPLLDITFVWSAGILSIHNLVEQDIIWRKKNTDVTNSFLLISYLSDKKVKNAVFEISKSVNSDHVYENIQEQVELARKKKSDEFWAQQPPSIQEIRIKTDSQNVKPKSGKHSFVAIDFEHATPDKGSVCAVGIVSVKNGEITDQYTSLIQPPNNEYFYANSLVHGIFETDTANSPTFREVWPEIKKRISNKTLVAHGANHTDRYCLENAMTINDIYESLDINWIDTQDVCNARLNLICDVCKIELNHHDALSDAIACTKMYLMYLNGTLPIKEILKQKKEVVPQKSYQGMHEKISGDILVPDFENVQNKNNPFFQKKVVITGLFKCWPERKKLALRLKELGADIDIGIGKYTNILCAGSGCGPSKLKKMQELIDAGKDAKILSEAEIIEMLKECGALEN